MLTIDPATTIREDGPMVSTTLNGVALISPGQCVMHCIECHASFVSGLYTERCQACFGEDITMVVLCMP